MFGDQPINYTLTAATAVSRYHIVQVSGAQYGGLATAVTQALVGVTQSEAAAAGDPLTICPLGRSKVVAGAAVTIGARVTTDASGRAIACTSGSVYVGVAIDAAAAAGDVFEVLVNATNDRMLT